MQQAFQGHLRDLVNKFPVIKDLLRPIYYRVTGMLPVTRGDMSGAFLRELIAKDNPVILEIGANDGTHTKWFKETFPAAIIHCFEPNPSALRRFSANVGRTEGVFLHEVAVSGSTGEILFYPSVSMDSGSGKETWDASGSLREPTGHLRVHPEISFADPIRIPSVRLDEWLSSQNLVEVDFIWMDVQGAELDVFSGARETLLRTRFLYTEYAVEELYKGQPSLIQILKALPEFRPMVRYLNDILMRNTLLT